jgi:hypothetical protein
MIDPCSEIEPNIDFAETQWLTLGAATLCVIERIIEAIENDPERAADRPGTDRRLVEEEMPEAVDAGWTPRANGETRAKIVAPKRELVAIFSRCGIVEGSERPRRRPVASVFDLSDGETQVGDRRPDEFVRAPTRAADARNARHIARVGRFMSCGLGVVPPLAAFLRRAFLRHIDADMTQHAGEAVALMSEESVFLREPVGRHVLSIREERAYRANVFVCQRHYVSPRYLDTPTACSCACSDGERCDEDDDERVADDRDRANDDRRYPAHAGLAIMRIAPT